MTLVQLLEQCVARGFQWQIDGGIGPNGVPYATAIVVQPAERPDRIAKVHTMCTRSGVPVPAAEALEEALASVVGKIAVAGHAHE